MLETVTAIPIAVRVTVALNSRMNTILEQIETSRSNGVRRKLNEVGRARLRTIEANLLEALSSNIGKPMSREELYRQVWKCEFRGTTRTIDQTVATLRKKLGATQRIVTVYRVGYSYQEAGNNRALAPHTQVVSAGGEQELSKS